MSIITVEPYETMSLPALKAELALWDRQVNAGWFSQCPEAQACRDRCAAWVERRETEARETRGAAA